MSDEPPSARTTTSVEIRCAHRETGVTLPMLRWLEETAARAIDTLGAHGSVSIRLVGDEEMAAAHLRHCAEPGTTDVITFDATAGDAARTRALDADLLVCVGEARRQAIARNLTFEREVLLYILHGVLHCLGEDDHEDAAFARMHAREDRILEAIGVGATFHAPVSEPAR
ncbi:MAG: rRNA maturation RNase YbeY [Planctomycetota bacterium]